MLYKKQEILLKEAIQTFKSNFYILLRLLKVPTFYTSAHVYQKTVL